MWMTLSGELCLRRALNWVERREDRDKFKAWCVLTCPVAEITAMVLRVAASEMTEEEWTAWVARSVRPL